MRQHLADLELQAEEDGLQVRGDQAIEDRLVEIGQAVTLELHRGGVHRAVEPAECVIGGTHHRLDGLGVGHVGLDELGPAAGAGDRPDGLLTPCRLTSATRTLAPAAANASAVARPMPLAPPVTRATRSWNGAVMPGT